MAIRAFYLAVLSGFLFACGGAGAAELGEARVASHIGQQLVADVELTTVEDPAAKVEVRLAHPDVYRGASIAMPAVLSSLNLNVMRRDGRQFLHLTTTRPVDSRHLHVYLELIDGGQRSVRLVTLWLTPDPNPAPAPMAAAAPAVVAAAPPARPLRAPRPAAALHEGEEYLEPRKAAPKRAAAPARKSPPPPAPLAAAAKAQEATAGTCAPQPAAEQLNACAVLGQKNAALRQDLGQLEARLKVLQVAAAGSAPTALEALPAPVSAPAPAPAPKGAPRIQLKPKKPAPPEPETPWGLIGGAVAATLVLAALAVALLRRRKRSTFGKIPKEHKPARTPTAADAEDTPKPSFMAAVRARLVPGAGKPPARAPVEPALDGEN